MRFGCRIAVVVALVVGSAMPVCAWEAAGHTMITQRALQLVPKEMKPFYEENARYVTAFCTLPDDWRVSKPESGSGHFIDLDLLSKPPFTDLIVDKASAEKRFGRESLQKAGTLPWTIEETFNKLVAAMKSGDNVQIGVRSALLAHYIADAHVPLHDTLYYDGKTPEARGIHYRWEAILAMDRLKPEMLTSSRPASVGPMLKSAFAWCIESYGKCDAICAADESARKLDPKMGYRYYKSMWDATGQLMITQCDHASERLAGAWIAAWNQAGRPKLSDKPALYFWTD